MKASIWFGFFLPSTFWVLTGCAGIHASSETKPESRSQEQTSALRLTDENQVIIKHTLMFDNDGNPLDPTGNTSCHPVSGSIFCNAERTNLPFHEYTKLKPDEYETYLGKIFTEINSSAEKNKEKKKKVLIFIHGGLNTQKESLDRVAKLTTEIMKDTDYYPIFIDWHSDLATSYFDHLFYIRQGEDLGRETTSESKTLFWKTVGYVGVPIQLGIDLTRSITRAPMVWRNLLENDLRSTNIPLLDDDDANNIARELECQQKYHRRPDSYENCIERGDPDIEKHYKSPGSPILSQVGGNPGNNLPLADRPNAVPFGAVKVGQDMRSDSERAMNVIKYVATIPFFKIITAPILDAGGPPAWDNMLRRITLLFHTDREFHNSDAKFPAHDEQKTTLSCIQADGGLSKFMRHLTKEIGDARDNWEITLVGHSMGSIVINQLIREFGVPSKSCEEKVDKETIKPLPFTNIVYMAAASTINDFKTSILPYLKTNAETKFYNLMLHRKAERGESSGLDTIPRGSLLVWIDGFLANPSNHLDRTLGRFDNFMLTIPHIPNDLRPRIHIRSFSAGMENDESKYDPQEHGHFTNPFRFWDEDCWVGKKSSWDCSMRN